MKFKSFLFGTLACVALAGCSNDDVVDNGQVDKLEGDNYMAVRFSMSGNTGSRAWDGKFAEGDEAEVKVNNAVFYFLDANYQGCATPSEIKNFDWNDGTDGTNVDLTSEAVIVIKNPVTTPKYIVTLINVTNSFGTQAPSLAELQALVADYSDTTSGFAMSNSVYGNVDGNITEVITATAIGENNIQPNEEAAKENPVSIPVERVLARVNKATLSTTISEDITNGDSHVGDEGDGNQVGQNPETQTLTGAIVGWWLNNTSNESYLVKKLEKTYADITAENTLGGASWWNDANNFRSYWATMPATNTYAKYTFADGLANANANYLYCMENTNQYNAVPTQNQATTMVVAVQWSETVGEGEQAVTKPVTLVRWRGEVYTEANFKARIADYYQAYRIKTVTSTTTGEGEGTTTETYSTIEDLLGFEYNTSTGDITIGEEAINDWEALVTVKALDTSDETKTLVKVTISGRDDNGNIIVSGSEPVGANDIQAEIRETVDRVDLWKDGYAYFYTPINHHQKTAATTGETATPATYTTGVIRNHLYNLNITAVEGLGTPVADTNIDITPGIPEGDEETYLAAEIQILSYKVVPTQDVELK